MEATRRRNTAIVAAMAVSVVALAAFFYKTGLALSPLILFGVALFLLHPYRKDSPFTQRLHLIIILAFAGWLVIELQMTLLPFFVGFVLAYLLEPLIKWLEQRNIPRWLSALAVILIFLGLVAGVSVFVFPQIISQLDTIIRRISMMLTNTTSYLDSRQFYRSMEHLGVDTVNLRKLIQSEFIPRIQGVSKIVFESVLALLSGVSSLASQVINVVLIPILTFYFIKDMPELKDFVRGLLWKKNKKFFLNLVRIHQVVKAYVMGQIISATFVGVASTIAFLFIGTPYPIFLGLMCGLLNPIPYVGLFGSGIIAAITILLGNPATNYVTQILLVQATIIILHFICTYFIDPRVTGERVGLHPLMLIAALFSFGHFFGILGLLVAVPVAGVLMMFFNDWRIKHNAIIDRAEEEEDAVQDEVDEELDRQRVRKI